MGLDLVRDVVRRVADLLQQLAGVGDGSKLATSMATTSKGAGAQRTGEIRWPAIRISTGSQALAPIR